jgi:hypothetical protein
LEEATKAVAKQTRREWKNMNSNSLLVDQLELKFIEGGAELLDNIRPLWERLNDLHAEKSPHFAEIFAKTSFSQRKVELENKATTGRLLVILAITKVDECIAYCVCSVGNESSNPSFAVSNQKGESERFLALNTRHLRRENFC